MVLSYLKRDRGFYRRLLTLSLPIVLQNLVTSMLGFADIFMVGLLGNAEMAAVTAANVPVFVVQVMMFGFQSGLTVLVSQYWGKQDMEQINRATGVALYIAVLLSFSIACLLCAFPRPILALVTDNPALVEIGRPYLQIVGFSYVFNSVSSIYAGLHRSTERPGFGLALFTASMCCNTFLNYIFIFGKLGAPALGVSGAAIATLLSRVLEFLIAAAYAVRCRRLPLLPAALLRPGKAMLARFLHYSTPVLCNEIFWSLGTAMFTVVLGHMTNSQDMLAAYAILGNVDKFATVICFGLAGAAAVIVGKEIGEGRPKEEVYGVSWSLLLVSGLVGIATGLLMLILLPTFFRPILFPLFEFTPGAAVAAGWMCLLYAVVMPMRAFDITNITGVLRAGGDARVVVFIDLIPLWCIAVPLTALAALWLQADVFWVCLAIQAENFFKLPVGIWRLHSRKWIRDVTR